MCFRPASAAMSVKCPQCGFDNPSVTEKCLECDADLTEAKANMASTDAAPSMPAPGAPSAPGVPGAPKAPGA